VIAAIKPVLATATPAKKAAVGRRREDIRAVYEFPVDTPGEALVIAQCGSTSSMEGIVASAHKRCPSPLTCSRSGE